MDMSPSSNMLFVSIITPDLLLPLSLILLLLIIILSASIKVVTEYERAVIFRLGRLIGVKGPGVVVILPVIDRRRIIDLRLVTFDVPKQRIITKDNVTVDVDAIVYFRVTDPMMAVLKVKDYFTASALLAQTTLRDVIGQVELDDLLTRREELNKRIQQILDEATEPWGIKVTTVALRDVVIPEMMQRAIAKQAEAERERRSRIIAAEGELMAAEKMAQAADYYAQHPIALRLRELQTWSEIAREKNMIVVTESATKELGTILGLTSQKKE
ncbi:membrane protease subunit [Candidatus Caldarchaeum subterraneum]|uniref:Membrane protease subunit n=1 Tax=Caldiarchaeum subterraneum TaxID=311458 RepID=E6N949_CALS0|nr:membrane protease subunit [Candidatus Caldarchaeum subterraneum]BAJ48851.1 membrane protease subunit [Candidatus Caldarchaeum subterraneum]BAJ51474.1 membrane protease subunit [Candidatus Caldarchaeum subterraneum]